MFKFREAFTKMTKIIRHVDNDLVPRVVCQQSSSRVLPPTILNESARKETLL